MNKQILQIENISPLELKNEILAGVKELLKESQSSQEDEVILTRHETAKMLSISLVSLWKWTSNGIIPAYRIGSKVRYKKSEILLALNKMNQFDDNTDEQQSTSNK